MWRLGVIYLLVAVVAALVSAVLGRGNWEVLAAITSALFFVLGLISFIAWILPANSRRPGLSR